VWGGGVSRMEVGWGLLEVSAWHSKGMVAAGKRARAGGGNERRGG
jgi:hypothetical protein